MGQKTSRYVVTKGFNAQVLIAKALQYWGDGIKTLTAFAEGTDADGTISLFNADSGVSLVGNAAVGASIPVVAVVRRGGKIYKSTPFSLGTHRVTKTPYAAAALGKFTVNTAGAVVVGKEYGVLIKDISNMNAASETSYRYSVIAVTGDTLTTLATKLAAKVNDAKSIANSPKDLIVNATVVGDDLVLEAKAVGITFTVGVFEQAYIDWTVSATTKPKWGQGTVDQVTEIEKEGWIFEGVTTNQPMEANPEDYGRPVSLVEATGTYDTFQIEGFVEKAGKGPINQEVDKQSIILFANKTGGAGAGAYDELATILGF